MSISWSGSSIIGSRIYLCWACSVKVAAQNGYRSTAGTVIWLCPNCSCPCFVNIHGQEVPSAPYGDSVQYLPDDVENLYSEARSCMMVNAYTAAVLLCRKLLMNISVQHGADEGKSFQFYINFLQDQGFIPPNGKEWVDHIRRKGNEATHEIAVMDKSHAEDLINFSEMLLRFIFEFPNRIPKRPSEK